MKNFIFKSPQGLTKNSSIPFDITVLNKNILYVTHQVDKILKLVTVLKLDKDLEFQAQQYFGEKSHQTELDEV